MGSLNFDQRSEHLNTEIGLLIDSPELAVGAAKRFESLTQPSNAYAVKLEGGESAAFRHLIWVTEKDGATTEQSIEPARSVWQRYKMRVLTWLPLGKEL